MTIGCANSLIMLNAIIVSIGAYYFYLKNLDITWLALLFFLAIASSGELILSGLCK